MSPLFNKQQEKAPLLCVDIGTASVKACIIQEKNENLVLSGFSEVPQEPGNLKDGTIVHLSKTITTLQHAIRDAENMARISTADVVFAFSGEMIRGANVTLAFHRQKPAKRIDEQEIKTIIYELQSQAFELIRNDIASELCLAAMDVKLVNASVLRVTIDQEIVSDILGKTGETVEMEIYNAFSPVKYSGHFQNIILELPYHQLRGVFVPTMAIGYCLQMNDALLDAIIIDIGAGTTEIGVYCNGRFMGSRSYAFGGNTISKRISYELSTSFEEADSIKLNYGNDTLEKKSQQVIGDILKHDLELWISGLDFCLKELPLKKLPQQIYLTGQGSLLREFYQVLGHHDWGNRFPIDGSMKISQLRASDITDNEGTREDFDQKFLPLLATAHAAYDLLHHHKSLENILSNMIEDKA